MSCSIRIRLLSGLESYLSTAHSPVRTSKSVFKLGLLTFAVLPDLLLLKRRQTRRDATGTWRGQLFRAAQGLDSRNSRDQQMWSKLAPKANATNTPSERKFPGSLMNATKSSSAKIVPKVSAIKSF